MKRVEDNPLGFTILPLPLCLLETFHNQLVFKNEYHRHHTELKKPDIKEYTLYHSMYIKLKKQAKPIEYMRRQESGYPW